MEEIRHLLKIHYDIEIDTDLSFINRDILNFPNVIEGLSLKGYNIHLRSDGSSLWRGDISHSYTEGINVFDEFVQTVKNGIISKLKGDPYERYYVIEDLYHGMLHVWGLSQTFYLDTKQIVEGLHKKYSQPATVRDCQNDVE